MRHSREKLPTCAGVEQSCRDGWLSGWMCPGDSSQITSLLSSTPGPHFLPQHEYSPLRPGHCACPCPTWGLERIRICQRHPGKEQELAWAGPDVYSSGHQVCVRSWVTVSLTCIDRVAGMLSELFSLCSSTRNLPQGKCVC